MPGVEKRELRWANISTGKRGVFKESLSYAEAKNFSRGILLGSGAYRIIVFDDKNSPRGVFFNNKTLFGGGLGIKIFGA
ncbi:MAG: hypothetical protein R6V40_02330 [Candidatus Moraniibacteriota bacterium]